MDDFSGIDEDARLLGIDEKVWKEFRKMTHNKYEQDDLPGYLGAEAQARETEIPEEERQRHLARWAMRFEKYGKLSGNPIAKRHYEQQKRKCLDMMCGRQRD